MTCGRRIDSISRKGIIVVDPGRTNRHIERYRDRLGNKNTKLVKKIVKLCLLEIRAMHGDERVPEDSYILKDEYQKLVSKYPEINTKIHFEYRD